MDINDLNDVTNKPGVYLWKNKYDEVIYVGKAKSLKKRMMQYFKNCINSYKTVKLVNEISSYEVIITLNEKEALLLEKNLIDKYFPKYNIKLMDHKKYPYIKISISNKKLIIKQEFRNYLLKRKRKHVYLWSIAIWLWFKKLSWFA